VIIASLATVARGDLKALTDALRSHLVDRLKC